MDANIATRTCEGIDGGVFDYEEMESLRRIG